MKSLQQAVVHAAQYGVETFEKRILFILVVFVWHWGGEYNQPLSRP
jgi:hypothetical protein